MIFTGKNRWFWSTFSFLTLFTLSVFSWALIYSPLRFDPRTLGHFKTELNGFQQDNILWVNDGEPKALGSLIDREWAHSGWRPVAQGMDFAPRLLGLSDLPTVLSPYVQMRVYENTGSYRTLGLMEDPQGDRTYGWVAESPKGLLDLQKARAHWSFPFAPPRDAKRLIHQQNPKFELAFIFLPKTHDLDDEFERSCRSQGFETRQFQGTPDHSDYLLVKGQVRLLALLEPGTKEDLISLVRFEKN
ncbi:MAG TPA: hypothetical protein VHE12_07225 [bacterium]|nr:hypothetical protein [bacterium]